MLNPDARSLEPSTWTRQIRTASSTGSTASAGPTPTARYYPPHTHCAVLPTPRPLCGATHWPHTHRAVLPTPHPERGTPEQVKNEQDNDGRLYVCDLGRDAVVQYALDHTLEVRHPLPFTRNPKPRNPEPGTRDPEPEKHNPE